MERKYDPATPPILGKRVVSKLSHRFYLEFPDLVHPPQVTDTLGCVFGAI